MNNPLSNHELKRLSKVLDALEADAYYPYKHHSGGFAEAQMFHYDLDSIDVELKFGVQNDCDSTIHKEQYEINRKTMEIIN
jgi:hypothetical protein